MEADGNQEDDKGGAGSDGDSHADEDRVKKDAGFEEEALEEELLRVFFGGTVLVGR